MLVSEGHTAARAMPMWVACAATRAMMTFRPKLLVRAMSGPMVLLLLGSILIFMAHVTTRVIGIMLKSKGHVDSGLNFFGPVEAGPAFVRDGITSQHPAGMRKLALMEWA